MPCQKLVTANKLASALSRNCSMMRWRDKVPWTRIGVSTRVSTDFGDAIHHRAIREQGERSSTGGADELDQLLDDRLFGPSIVARRKVLGHVEQRIRLVVKGAVDVLDGDVPPRARGP